jgi:glycosyltransferase involved in cell wall biosynthesis
LKILFVNSFDDISNGGGAEVTLWTLLRALTRAGHQCTLLSTSDIPGLHSLEREGVRIWRAGIKNIYWHGERRKRSGWMRRFWHLIDAFNPSMKRQFERVVVAERPDIISLHNLSGWSSSVLAAVGQSRIPSIQVLHDFYSLCPKSSMYKAGRNCGSPCSDCRILRIPPSMTAGAVTAVVGVSRFILEKHTKHGRFADVAIKRVILNARSSDMIAPAAPRESAELRIGFIGRLDPAKGVETLIDAFRISGLANAKLVIAGAGEDSYVASLRVRAGDSDIVFLGRVIPGDFYSDVDVVVVPSRWNEPLGMVVIEAMAHGKPVIGSRRGGIPELIEDNVDGLLFNPEDTGQLASLLRRLASEDGLLQALGSAALLSSTPFLDADAWASRYVSLYDEVLVHCGLIEASKGEEIV